MALIDFGMKARRERDAALLRADSLEWELTFHDADRRAAQRFIVALNEIANSTAKAGSAVRLRNIARKALGRPVKGGGEQ